MKLLEKMDNIFLLIALGFAAFIAICFFGFHLVMLPFYANLNIVATAALGAYLIDRSQKNQNGKACMIQGVVGTLFIGLAGSTLMSMLFLGSIKIGGLVSTGLMGMVTILAIPYILDMLSTDQASSDSKDNSKLYKAYIALAIVSIVPQLLHISFIIEFFKNPTWMASPEFASVVVITCLGLYAIAKIIAMKCDLSLDTSKWNIKARSSKNMEQEQTHKYSQINSLRIDESLTQEVEYANETVAL